MKKLIAGALLISGITLAAGATYADGYGHDGRGYSGPEREYERGEEARYRDNDRDGDHHFSLFGWKMPFGWDDDDDDDHRGGRGQAAAQNPTGPINNNKLINKGSSPKVTMN